MSNIDVGTNPQQIDFTSISNRLLSKAEFIVADLVPGGKRVGPEYRAGALRGGPGDSFGFNLITGKWADFATGQKGGDLISLYAEIHNVNQGEAARKLSEVYLGEVNIKSQHPQESPPNLKPKYVLTAPPVDVAAPEFGKPDLVHEYLGKNNELLFYVTRYTHSGKKTFVPWSWSTEGKWVKKLWDAPRPLYGLHNVHKYASKPILIVEGEKACDAASKITQAYVVVTWPSGAQAWNKVDWSPIYGRKVLVWPDADKPGIQAGTMIASMLLDKCAEVKFLNADRDHSDGWDAADALAEGWNHKAFSEWAKSVVQVVNKPKSVVPEVMPDREPTRRKQEPREVNLNISLSNDPDTVQVPVNRHLLYVELGLEMTHDNTRLVMNSGNVVKILKGLPDFKDLVWTDTFYNQVLTKWNTGIVRPWSEIDDIKFYIMLQNVYGFTKISKHHVSDAINDVASNIQKHEPRDWLTGLTWDGEPRVEQFFIKTLQAKDSEYTRIVCKNFLVAMVARIMDPGCKADQMVILEGRQGSRKSTFASIMGGKWFAEANADIGTKDFDMSMQGKLLMEIGELDKMSKADIKTIKNKLSQRIDEYRPAYGRSVQKFPRTCLLIGTTNEDDYLDDVTGARRFFPIIVGNRIDTEYAESVRDQIFAEALELYKSGYQWHQEPPRSKEVQESRRKQDAWEDVIGRWLNERTVPGSFNTHDIWTDALKGEASRLGKPDQNRIGRCMRILGYRLHPKRVGVGGKLVKVWTKQHDESNSDKLKSSEIDTDANDEEGETVNMDHKPWNFAPGADNTGRNRNVTF